MSGSSEVVVEGDIAAPVEQVFALLSDIMLMPRFSSELQSVQWEPGFGGAALGARFRGTNRHPAIGEWTTTSQIVEFDPPRRFGWAVGDPDSPAAIWSFEVFPTAEGSRLRYTARLGPGRSGVTMLVEREPDRAAEIIERRLGQWRAGMQGVVEGIKELAER